MEREFVLNSSVAIERYFEEISRIPRNSAQEQQVSNYVVDFAKARGLDVYQDALFNVIVKKPASPGYEDCPPLILQAHLDMVCIKTADSSHDFTTDPLELYVENGILRAKNTSLGADDGVGVAYMLAILDDRSLAHPPLECVFTTQEETGHAGAKALDPSQLKGRRFINLDGKDAFCTYVANFRSDLIVLERALRMAPPEGAAARIHITDMYTNVYEGVAHPECGNPVKVLARLLKSLVEQGIPVRLYELRGGVPEREQMVPEFATAGFTYTGCTSEKLRTALEEAFAQFMQECEDPIYTGKLTFEEDAVPEQAADAQDSRACIDLLYLLPVNLFQAGTADKQMTSINNLGAAVLDENRARIILSHRSKYVSAAMQLMQHCKTLAELTGFSFASSVRYESWPYQKDSRLRVLANRVAQKLYGRQITELVAAGGLEISDFVSRIPGLDVLELGPDMDNIHTVDEYLNLESFHTIYQLLIEVLKNAKQ